MYISALTLDDLLKEVLEAIIKDGQAIESSRGKNRELRGVVLKLANPRARLSHSEKRGVMFSPLGELAWYLAQSNREDFITYYIPRYSLDAEEDGTIHGAYGPRIFGDQWNNQFAAVAEMLREKPSTRRAVLQIYDSQDLLGTPKEVPCTISLQFLIRDSLLDLVVSMRSNDAFMGLPHDVFSFTMLQEIMARAVDCEIGQYIHFAGSIHLYDEHYEDAKRYVAEGWQATEDAAMPPMSLGDPWPSIDCWLKAEAAIRSGTEPDTHIQKLDEYWQDLTRLLQVFRYSKEKDIASVSKLKNEMQCEVYKEYIVKRERRT